MKNRPVMFGKIAFARGAVELSPGAATGMAVGTEVAQPEPAAIVTTSVGTEVPRGLHHPGASVRWGHRVRPLRRRWSRLIGFLFTQRTVRLVRSEERRVGKESGWWA